MLKNTKIVATIGPSCADEKTLTQMVKAGDVVLFHDSMEVTLKILPEFIENVQKKGLKIVGVDELLNIQAYA